MSVRLEGLGKHFCNIVIIVLNVQFLKTGVGLSQHLEDSEGGKSHCPLQVIRTLFAI